MIAIPQAFFFGSELHTASASFGEDLAASAAKVIQQIQFDSDSESMILLPIGKDHVATIRGRGRDIHVLAIPSHLYRIISDPFAFARQFPAEFSSKGPLADLIWNGDVPRRRTVDQLRGVLKHDDGPMLLGASQSLVDGGRVAFVRQRADLGVIERLWQLLPDSVRGELKVGIFATSEESRFDLVMVPTTHHAVGYLTDDQAADYPQGQYELNLQIAVEADDQAELDRLLARRSSKQALRLMVFVLVMALVIGLASRILMQ